jgi:hypothetical protein
MDQDNHVLLKWSEIKETIESLELDVVKSARGVTAAGIRARKGLRILKSKAQELVKLTLEAKVKKEEKDESN